MSYFEEGQIGRKIEEVCQTNKCICSFQVEEKHSCQEGHPLDIANVRPIASVGAQDVMQGVVVGPTLEAAQRRGW